MPVNIIGWDIGGAHLKMTVLNPAGTIIAIEQQPCPLWLGIEQLRHAVTQLMQTLNPKASYRHAITMTGELVDLFANRSEGVQQIIATMQNVLADTSITIFAGPSGFVTADQIRHRHYAEIASANWLASALFTAQRLANGLFVDIGSTTTDILLIGNHQVLAQGYSDYQRLVSKELIYTGMVRTAVMAVTRTVQDEGHEVGLMAEYFATMADVYRVTGELDERCDQSQTADGAEKTVVASARRLARMIGCDFSTDSLPRWQRFAENIRHQQLQHIQQGCRVQLDRHHSPGGITFVGAGIGRTIVEEIALQMNRPYVDFSDLCSDFSPPLNLKPADCAPAVAVAYLAKANI